MIGIFTENLYTGSNMNVVKHQTSHKYDFLISLKKTSKQKSPLKKSASRLKSAKKPYEQLADAYTYLQYPCPSTHTTIPTPNKQTSGKIFLKA